MRTRRSSFTYILLAYLLSVSSGFLYLSMFHQNHVLVDSFIADVLATIVIFIFSRFFKNSSFYDAYWSVIPPLFLLYWWFTKGVDTSFMRYIFVSIVVWFWAIRLTLNWAKHWPGLEHEDWRYAIVRQRAPKLEVFLDFFGIHFFPTVQVFLGMLPLYAAVALSNRGIGVLDYVALVVGISAVVIQLVADRQLHTFLAVRKPGEIISHGLWRWSRHPNYLGEILFWFSLALFGLGSYPEGWWWQPLGFVAMLAMFVFASIPLMEKRSLERRPKYQEVINTTPMLFPRLSISTLFQNKDSKSG